jgi:hypothetical protein
MKSLFSSLLAVSLAGCATQSAPVNGDSSPPTALALVRGFDLRDRYQAPKPVAANIIYVDSVAVHHVYSEASTVVWKDEAGRWKRSQVIEEGPGGLLQIGRRLELNVITILPSAAAKSLDQLIKDTELYNGKVRRTGKIGIGATFHVMAIVTPYGRTTVEWDGRLRGKTGAVADIVLGHE